MVKNQIELGAIFERCDMTSSQWKVEGVIIIDGIPHAYIRRLETKADIKLLAVSALNDKKTFRCVIAAAHCGSDPLEQS